MIGFYDYTVVLTYLGALAGLWSIVLSARGMYLAAIYCLGAALFCDTLDGMVARTKKGRTEREMRFGIQIDSLCDVISFGVAPAGMFFTLGLKRGLDIVLLGAYCVCCVIRLAYFNILAGEAELGTKGDFRGMPVPSLTILIPILYLSYCFLPNPWDRSLLRLAMAVMGFLYILDFKVKKPNLTKLIIMCLVFWVPVAVLAFLVAR